jgi:hypothetical protein
MTIIRGSRWRTSSRLDDCAYVSAIVPESRGSQELDSICISITCIYIYVGRVVVIIFTYTRLTHEARMAYQYEPDVLTYQGRLMNKSNILG